MRPRVDLVSVVRGFGADDFIAAARRIETDVLRSPLLPYAGNAKIRLKAECLQPFGSFKIRAASNALQTLDRSLLRSGVATASAGNFAQGLALAARRRQLPLTVHAPQTAARVKLDTIASLGAKVVMHPFAEWWSIMSTRSTGADDGAFIHPVCEPGVILGNGTIGLELAQDWPELDTVVIPFGGGGLSCGIALALRALSKRVRIIACEVEHAAPLAAALAAQAPLSVERVPSFVDGIGSTRVLDEMWPLLKELIDEVIVVGLAEIKAALNELALRHHLIAEGAGAAALAAALSPRCKGKHIAAIISGGNIDPAVLSPILAESRSEH